MHRLLLVLGTLLLGAPASALTLVATSTGAVVPPTATFPTPAINGDFTITANLSDPIAGNGGDEITTWDADFTGDPGFASWTASMTLTSAVLTVTLNNYSTVTDLIGVESLGVLGVSEVQSLGVGSAATVAIDLLLPGRYTAAALRDEFETTGGVLGMRYEDDATVSFAELELVFSTPEPSALLLLAIAGLAVRRRDAPAR